MFRPPKFSETTEKPDLRIIDEALWDKVKARQDLIDSSRTRAEADGKTGAGAAQSARRRKYLLSGLLTCGQCGGNLNVAGKGDRRRYYCANAKEKGEAVCTGMPGLSEADAAETILGGLREGRMQEKEYEKFRSSYVAKMRAEEQENGRVLQRHDALIREVEKEHANLVRAVKEGGFSNVLIEQLEMAGGLHTLVETVVVSWDEEADLHTMEIRGKLLELLSFENSKKGRDPFGCGLFTKAGCGSRI